MSTDGGPAFPETGERLFVSDDGTQQRVVFGQTGMALRDWFAGQALAFMPPKDWDEHEGTVQEADAIVSALAYRLADAMLKAREK